MTAMVADLSPSLVFHLAGQTPPGDPIGFYSRNTLATVHLLDALRAVRKPCRIVLVGSAAELGPVPVEALPVAEDYACRPTDPYGLSKHLATCAGLAAGPPLDVIIARVFNPIGPGLPTTQALGRFSSELASGSGPIRLRVGDLGARRDFVDVRDVAKALLGLARLGRPGQVYHIGTGRSRRVGDGLDLIIARSGRDVSIEVDPNSTRSPGPSDSRADIRRVVEQIGWSPETSFEDSIHDLWDDAVSRIGVGLTGDRGPV